MLKWLRRLFAEETREERVLRECGCVVWCPECRSILNDGTHTYFYTSDGTVEYWCRECEGMSEWLFDAPVPIRIHPLTERKEGGDGEA